MIYDKILQFSYLVKANFNVTLNLIMKQANILCRASYVLVLILLISNILYANDPCNALVYDFGMGAENVIPCGNAANATSGITVTDVEGPTSYPLNGTCGMPLVANNSNVSWIRLTLLAEVGFFEWQLVGNDLVYEVYAASDACVNDCNSLDFIECGTDFASWSPLLPNFPVTTTYFYFAIFQGVEGGDNDFVFKARKACGEGCPTILIDSPPDCLGGMSCYTLSASGGTPPYNFYTSPIEGNPCQGDSLTSIIEFCPTVSGDYSFWAVDQASNCVGEATFSLTVDIDSDGDGFVDCEDPCPMDPCCPNSSDSDGDGVSDCMDLCPGFDDNIDLNGNGIPDDCECSPNAGIVVGANQQLCPGESFDPVLISGNNTAAGYMSVFLFVDTDMETILDINMTGLFSAPNSDCTSASYYVYAYNYQIGSAAIANPTTISSIDCTTACCDLSQAAFTLSTADSTPPIISCPPGNSGLSCGDMAAQVYLDAASFLAAGGSFSDNCSSMAELSFEYLGETLSGSGDCAAPGMEVIRSYQVTDLCGNSAFCEQSFIFLPDSTPPIISCPTAVTGLGCNDVLPAAYSDVSQFIAGGGSVSDDCSATSELSFSMIQEMDNGEDNCTGTRIVTRVYQVLDACGNEAICEQSFSFSPDNNSPIVSCPSSGMSLMCGDMAPPMLNSIADFLAQPGASVVDDCSNINELSITLISETNNGGGDCQNNPLLVTRVYEIADACGNASTCTQVFEYESDALAPIVTCPNSITLDACDSPIPDAFVTINDFLVAGGTATDNCHPTDNLILSLLSETNNAATGCDNDNILITRIYEVADLCGNSTTCQQTITIPPDNEGPTVICIPDQLELICGDQLPAPVSNPSSFIAAGGSISDNCVLNNEISVVHISDDSNQNTGCVGEVLQIIRTYQVSDACGNVTECTQRFRYLPDTEAPVIDCPPAITGLTCGEQAPLPFTSITAFQNAGGTLSDNCTDLANLSLTHLSDTDNMDFGCFGAERIITRTYSVSDACGNVSTCEQAIIYDADNTPPQITCPPTVTGILCGEALPSAAFSYTSFVNLGGGISDNCFSSSSDFTVLVLEESDNSNSICDGDAFIVTRTYQVSDACGNISTCAQNFVYANDVDAPEIQCPADVTNLACGEAPPAGAINYQEFVNLGGTISDNCSIDDSEFVVSFSDNLDISAVCPVGTATIIVRTYTISDGCGNSSSCTQQFIYPDPNPSISVQKVGELLDINLDNIPQPGESIRYTFTVINTGNVDISNIQINDPLITVQGGSIPYLAVGESNSTTFSGVYVLTQDDIINGSVLNSATAQGTDPSGTEVSDISDDPIDPTNSDINGDGEPDDPTIISIPQVPDINLLKIGYLTDENQDGLTQVGETITFVFVVTNLGNVPLTNITVTDPLIDVIGGPIASLGPLEANASTFSGVYTITQTDINNGMVINSAITEGTAPDGSSVSDVSDDPNNFMNIDPNGDGDPDDPTIISLVPFASLSLQKVGTFEDENGDGFAQVGETISYQFLITNNGNLTLNNLSVTDPIVAVNGGPLASLDPLQTDSFTFSAVYIINQTDIENGFVVNSAIVNAFDPSGTNIEDISDDPFEPANVDLNANGDPDDPTVVPLPQNASLELLKTGFFVDENADGVPQEGESISYTLTVINTGTTPLSNVTISDALIDLSDALIGDLAVGASATISGSYSLTALDIENGEVINTALAQATDPGGSIINDVSDDPTDPTNIDINGDGEPDDPTIVPLPQLANLDCIYVWFDENNNGIYESTEPALDSILVELYDVGPDGFSGTPDDFLIVSEYSDVNGSITFERILIGSQVYLKFPIIASNANFLDISMSLLTNAAGSTEENDSDANSLSGFTPIYEVQSGNNCSLFGAGFVSIISLDAELLSFNIEVIDCKVRLTWEASNQINTQSYLIEHSTDAENFDELIEIPANSLLNFQIYSYDHYTARQGINYYRIIEKELDGQLEYKTIGDVRVSCKDKPDDLFNIYPNPIESLINIYFNPSLKDEIIEVNLYDEVGQLISKYKVESSKDLLLHQIDLTGKARGIYFIKAKSGSTSQSEKIIKLR